MQSKKLYANTLKFKPYDPYFRAEMGRLLVTDDEHQELIKPKLLKYTEKSKYKALQLGSEQQQAMSGFSQRFNIKLHYLLYNPSVIPWEIKSPVENMPVINENKVGCRIIPKQLIDKELEKKNAKYSPTFQDMKDLFKSESLLQEDEAGWRMESFITNLFIKGNEGFVDDSPNFEIMLDLLSQKSSPISSALSITFDIPE